MPSFSPFALSVAAALLCCLAACGIAVVRLRRALGRERAALAAERQAGEYFRLAAEHANDGLVIQTMDATVLWTNPAYLRIMDLPAEKVLGRNPLTFALAPEDTPPAEEIAAFRYDPDSGNEPQLHLFRNVRGDGTPFWNQINIGFRRAASGEHHAILVCRDVTELVAKEDSLRAMRDRLAHEASHDSLTGLANRAELMRFTRDVLGRAADTGQRIGMLHIDLDRFKEINDTHGHSAGDATLRHAATQLRAILRAGDLVARVGGDEFVVVCPGLTDLCTLERLGRDLGTAIARPFGWRDLTLWCRASIGCALSGPATTDPEALLLQSDFALYEAKRNGRAQVAVYDETLHQRHLSVQRRAADLREAVEIGAFTHLFQPVQDLQSGRITGFETLVRWPYEAEGTVTPRDFLPLAEEMGLLAQVDLTSMEAALAMKRQLALAGRPEMSVSFNASPDLLRHPSFINRLVFGAEAGGMDRSQIAIEVLETTVFADRGDAGSPSGIVRDLRDAGFQVFLDDFGMGYAGLAHLAELAITGIKLDKLLVQKLLTSETSAKIVATIIDLCRDLDLLVVAEGVEDAATAARLRAMGCPRVQGYLLSRPLPADGALSFACAAPGTRRAPPRRPAVRA